MKILDRLPLLPGTRTIQFGQRHVPFHRNALLVWVGVSLQGELPAPSASTASPALLDSGNNGDCFLHEHHLTHWAGIHPDQLEILRVFRVNDLLVPHRRADVWIYPNRPGACERDPDREPFRLNIENGLSVAPARADGSIFPRVPLLGFSALRQNALDYWFDSKSGHSYLRTAGWRSRVIRWLCRAG